MTVLHFQRFQSSTPLSRRDNVETARRFNAGLRGGVPRSPAGTAEALYRPFGTWYLDRLEPGVETPGYSRISLRDRSGFECPAVAPKVPFKNFFGRLQSLVTTHKLAHLLPETVPLSLK